MCYTDCGGEGMNEMNVENHSRQVLDPIEPFVVVDPGRRSAAFGLNMSKALAHAMTSRNMTMEAQISMNQQMTIIESLAESFAHAKGLTDLQTIIAQLQKSYGKEQFPIVAQWLNAQASSVNQLIASCQGALDQYHAQLNAFNDYVNKQWGELYRHSNFATAFTYQQFVTYMSGKGDPVCTVPGSKYYGHSISYELKPLPGRIGDEKGLWFNFNYHPNRKKTTGMFDKASAYYDIWKGQMATSLHSFTATMTTQSNSLHQKMTEFSEHEIDLVSMLRNMSTIPSNLSFDPANLPGE